jgi:hypothetical protein
VAVGVKGDSDRGVPKEFLNHLDVHALAQHQGCAGVAQIVQADVRQPRVFQDRLEATARQVPGVHRRALPRREYKPLIFVAVPAPVDLHQLAFEVRPEGI